MKKIFLVSFLSLLSMMTLCSFAMHPQGPPPKGAMHTGHKHMSPPPPPPRGHHHPHLGINWNYGYNYNYGYSYGAVPMGCYYEYSAFYPPRLICPRMNNFGIHISI